MDPLKTSTPPEAKLHFLDYWRIIRIRKTVILAVFLLVVITATIVTWILPESYSSTARINVQRDVADVSGVQNGMVAGMSSYDPYFIQTEFEVIQSEIILDQVIQNLNLNKVWGDKYHLDAPLKTAESRRILKGLIELRPTRNTSLIEIRVSSDSPEEAARIANEIATTYATHRQNERRDLTLHGIKTFEDKLKEYDNSVANQEQKVDKLRSELGVVDTDPQSTGPGSTLGPVNVLHYNSLKIDNEAQWIKGAELLKKLKEIQSTNVTLLRQALPTAAPDGILTQLLQDYISTEEKLVTQLNDLGPNHPDVQRTIKLRDQLDHKIDERVTGIIKGMEVQVSALYAVVSNSVQQVEEAKSNDMRLAESSRPYFLAKADLDRIKKFRDVLAMRMQQESIEVALPRETMVTEVDKAEVNTRPVRPNKPLNVALGIIIGLVVGVGLAFFIEYLDTSVKTIDDVERTLQAPVLGVIPQNVGYLLEEGADSPHAEAYRVLRTNLLFSRKDDKLNTVAVVSAGAGEGKSTTVFNLATVFAQGGQRVLMVDSDLRRPTLHKLLNVANNLGLTNYLMKQNSLEEVIQTTGLASLDFMASGKLPSSSLGILNSAQMKDLISELKQRYDYVFFDSPPIMGVSDASILASEVDMTLQVIQYRRYPQPMNVRAKQLIEKVGGNLVGIVLNNINMSQDESYYYYSGYYHYYYSKNDEDGTPARSNGAGSEDKPRVDIKPKY
ncbi:MAG TPA: polysaccharide biosynthesis tyrosine autokinase [Verrucomicrobiae bacterium]|nr:polysaccharide biosynthesis tyrosine autokinase [Verrucomicrobiae bacterium]